MRGPKSAFTIRDHFTCRSWNLIYCISCRRCPLYIGETGRNLRTRFSEHLGSIRNSTPGFPVAQNFNSMDHRISDVQVLGVALCSGTNTQREQREIRLIFQLGTVQRKGLNINFSFIWTVTLYTSCTRFDHFYVYGNCVVQRFSSHWRRVIHPKRPFFKIFDIFWYFIWISLHTILLDPYNSSDHAQSHSIIANCYSLPFLIGFNLPAHFS